MDSTPERFLHHSLGSLPTEGPGWGGRMPRGGELEIVVITASPGGQVWVEVRDTGCGILPENLEARLRVSRKLVPVPTVLSTARWPPLSSA